MKSFRPPAPDGWHYSHTFTQSGIVLVSYESEVQDQRDLTGKPASRMLNINLIDAQNTPFAQSDRQALLHEYVGSIAVADNAKSSEAQLSISGMPATSWIDADGPLPTAVVVVAVNPQQLIQVVSPNESVETLTTIATQVVGK